MSGLLCECVSECFTVCNMLAYPACLSCWNCFGIFVKTQLPWSGEVARWLEHLSRNHEDWDLDLQKPMGMLGSHGSLPVIPASEEMSLLGNYLVN